MNYEEALIKKEQLNNKVDECSLVLNSFESSTYGLISEEIRKSEEYRFAKANYDRAFSELRDFNSWFVKNFKGKSKNNK